MILDLFKPIGIFLFRITWLIIFYQKEISACVGFVNIESWIRSKAGALSFFI